MCGYCTEQNVFVALQNNGNAPPDSPEKFFEIFLYLQEVRDLPSALKKYSETTLSEPFFSPIFLCRALDILDTYGFESEFYQALLEEPLFRSAIQAACNASAEAISSDMDLRFNLSSLAWLTENETYLVSGNYEQHISKTDNELCTSILNDYVQWWLEDGSVPHQDLDQIMNDTGIMNPIDDIPESERVSLHSRLFTFWLAMLKISRQPEGTEILWKIISRNPSGVPDFDALDLWLQRRATLAYYDKYGIDSFLSGNQPIRSTLFRYLAATRLCKSEKNAVLAALEKHGNDGYSDPEEWQWVNN